MPKITRPPRQFLPENFEVTTWKNLEPFFEKLLKRELKSVQELETLLKDKSELEAVLEEMFAWRYIKTNANTRDEEAKKSFEAFVTNIQPHLAVADDRLNNIIVRSVFFKKLSETVYMTYKRSVQTSVEIFREKNVPLFTELEIESQQFGVINGAMTVEVAKEELTLQQAGVKLQEPDRALRESVYRKIVSRRMKDKVVLDDLMTSLVKKRHKVAHNVGFKNFRDYMFASMGRFDYTADDCKKFHDSVRDEIIPLIKKIHQNRANKLGIEKLKPWDLDVDITGKPPLRPFEDSKELIKKSKACFKALDPFFEEVLETMDDMGHFDLDSRKNKAPGGFMYPLYEIGVPFIYMNSVGSHRDLETIVHEGGHAIHSMLTRHYKLNTWKSTPPEVAELASMSMELISMSHWDEFYDNDEELQRARQQQLQNAIMTLPGVARGDKFQHWMYENPNHTVEERASMWAKISAEFETGLVDKEGFEESSKYAWQSIMHFYEVPFYYIEYGFAQLGAMSVWKNFTEDRKKGLGGYKNFMKLGYTKTIPEIYKSAGIEFDFSKKHIKRLAAFIETRMNFD